MLVRPAATAACAIEHDGRNKRPRATEEIELIEVQMSLQDIAGESVGSVGQSAAACALTFALALTGCASRPPLGAASAADHVDVPSAWSTGYAPAAPAAASADAHSTPLAQWWQQFDDPALDALVTRALQANTNVKTAQAALRQARALRDVAAAALWPGIGLSASAQHSTAGGHGSNYLQAGVNVNWLPDVFGANRSALDANESLVAASAASLGDAQAAIAAEVGLNYILLRSSQARLGIARDNLASQQETLQITQWRYQAGLVTSVEAEQARASAEQTGALLPTLQTGIDQTRHALAVLVGEPPAAMSPMLSTLDAAGPVPQAREGLALAIPAEALRQRADVRAAEYQVTAAWARVAQADAARFPGFSLGGSLGSSAATLGSLTSGASVVSSLLASVTWPLFDGGAARAQVRAQEAAFDQARVAYQATLLNAFKDVEDALIALRGDRARLLSLGNASAAATNAAELARQRFSSGLVDFQTVLETQRTQLSAQDSVASARADVSADHVRLFKALGGGWKTEESDERNDQRSSESSDRVAAPTLAVSAAPVAQIARTSMP